MFAIPSAGLMTTLTISLWSVPIITNYYTVSEEIL